MLSSPASGSSESDAVSPEWTEGSACHGSKVLSSAESPRTLRQASRAFRPMAPRFSETATPTATPTAAPTTTAPIPPGERVFDACSSTSFETGRARRTNWALASRSPPAPTASFERSRPDVSTANRRRSSRFFGTEAAYRRRDTSTDHCGYVSAVLSAVSSVRVPPGRRPHDKRWMRCQGSAAWPTSRPSPHRTIGGCLIQRNAEFLLAHRAREWKPLEPCSRSCCPTVNQSSGAKVCSNQEAIPSTP